MGLNMNFGAVLLLTWSLMNGLTIAVDHYLECNDQPSTLCLTPGYSTFELPFRNTPNLIKIGFEISDVLRISDKDYSITFGLYFSVEWFEPRLNLSRELWGSDRADTELIPVNLELINYLWIPNIFIYNLKTFQTIEVLSKLAGLWIDAQKRIYYSQATHITFICPMVFDSFPLDTQTCKFQVGSYSYDMSRMVFDVSTLGYIQQSQSITLDYKITINDLKKQDQLFNGGALGNFSLAGFEMKLERHFMSYIITYYLPSGLFVVVSWISFLIPPDIVPGRMALLITLFLVLVNIFNNVTTNSPKAETLTAIEIWMLACILFVFGSLIVYAVILNQKLINKSRKKEARSFKPLHKKRKKKDSEKESVKLTTDIDKPFTMDNKCLLPDETDAANMLSCTNNKGVSTNGHNDGLEYHNHVHNNARRSMSIKAVPFNHIHQYAGVDRFFLFFSPLLFLFFNLFYWGYFLTWDTWNVKSTAHLD